MSFDNRLSIPQNDNMLTTRNARPDDLLAMVDAARARGMRVRPKVGGFPWLAEALRSAGIERLEFVVPSMTSVYVTSRGDVVEQGAPVVTGSAMVAPFDRDALIAALRADQQGLSTFPEFVTAAWRAGVLSWTVDLVARTCTYRSARGGESYVESYPAVELP